MNHIVLSDEALKQAAASVRQSLLDSLPPPSQCEYEFSDTFQAKMKHLITRYDLRRRTHKAVQRVAAVFLAALISVSVWLSVDTQARAAFFSWVREVYQEHVVYRFFGNPTAEELPAYRITWLPEGYEEIDVYNDGKIYNALYQKGDDMMSAFVFEYIFTQDGSLTEMLSFDDENYNYKVIDVNGVQADFYESLLPEETSCLIWVDENKNIMFSLNGFPEESVIVHIAESIVLTNFTK